METFITTFEQRGKVYNIHCTGCHISEITKLADYLDDQEDVEVSELRWNHLIKDGVIILSLIHERDANYLQSLIDKFNQL